MNKHTATFNGQTFTRNSKGRRYSHVVIGLPSHIDAIKSANLVPDSPVTKADWEYQSSDRCTTDWRGNVDPELVAKRDQFRKDFPTLESYQEHELTDAVMRVHEEFVKGVYDTYCAIGWAGRLDLAEKVASQNRGNSYWADVRIVEAEIK